MNIYEDNDLEQKLDELAELVGRIILDMLLVSLRKVCNEQQIFQEFVETRDSTTKQTEPF